MNLIPLNPIEEYNKTKASGNAIKEFKNGLNQNGIATTIRREMGSDINAACGQLRRKYVKG